MANIIRYNYNIFGGEEYINRLQSEAERSFRILLSLLSSYWQSTIDGPNYARELKAVAIELSRLRLALEDIQQDVNYATTRTEFLYQVVTSTLFPQPSGAPNLNKSDEDFRQFLLQIIKIYYAGSIPDSLSKVVQLVTNEQVVIHENFLEARRSGSGYDISDQFGFSVDIILNSPGQIDVFTANRNIRLLFSIIRPAHTLYKLKFILQDTYLGSRHTNLNIQTNKIRDENRWIFSDYRYEDFRKFVEGVQGVDPFGSKRTISIVNEDHSDDFS
jgi:hypothetical protein